MMRVIIATLLLVLTGREATANNCEYLEKTIISSVTLADINRSLALKTRKNSESHPKLTMSELEEVKYFRERMEEALSHAERLSKIFRDLCK